MNLANEFRARDLERQAADLHQQAQEPHWTDDNVMRWGIDGDPEIARRWKGNCFEAAATVLLFMNERTGIPLADQLLDENAVLVHGSPMGQGTVEGKRILHAWIESRGMVYDATHNAWFVQGAYYRMGDLNESLVRRYSQKEARRLICDHGHWGSWDDTLEGVSNERLDRHKKARRVPR